MSWQGPQYDFPVGTPRTFAPGIGMVAWGCPKPTDPLPPVYAVGTNGWFHEQAYLMSSGRKTYDQVRAEFEAAR